MIKSFFIVLCITIFSLSLEAQVFQTEWLCPYPQQHVKQHVKISGMQKYYAMPGKYGKEKFILWPAKGNSLTEVEYMDSLTVKKSQFYLFSPDREYEKYSLKNTKSGYAFLYDFGKEGYHNAYMINKYLIHDTLFIMISKAERLSHKCRNGHKDVQKKIEPLIYPNLIPFEMIRLRMKPGENYHFLLESGNHVTFKVLHRGKEVKGAEVTFTTNKDWHKTIITNKKGTATFQVPSDYFPSMGELKQKKVSYYLVKAKFTVALDSKDTNSQFKYICYTCTYPGEYIPSQSLYKSSFWAVIVIVVSVLIISIIVIISRSEKNKILSRL